MGRGQTYAELSTMLGMPASRVRELAREALADLAPATAKRVDPDWRGQVADYVLGQQTGPESTATRGHLKRSEPARAWAFSLLDSLSHLYPNGNTPAIPDGDDRGAPEPPAKPEPEPEAEPAPKTKPAAAAPAPRQAAPAPARPSGAGLSPAAQAIVRRRRIVGGVIGVAVLAVVVLLITGVIGGGGGGGKKKEASSSTATSAQDNAYEVWLYNSNSDTVSLGAQFTDAQGNLQGRGDVPSNWRHFKTVVLSSERVGTNPKAPSNIVLQGTLAAVPASQQKSGSGSSGTVLSVGTLKPPSGAQGTGVALVVRQGGQQQLVLQAAQLKPTARVLQAAGPTGATGATGATGP